ncbi:MAG: archease [Gammaproteobacteria bacterium]
MARTGWEHFSHVADVGVRGFGPDLATAFEQVALALTAVVIDAETVRDSEAVEIECECDDPEILLLDWLNAIIYEMATRNMIFCRYAVRIDGSRLDGKAFGEAVDRTRHEPAVEPKGATLTELEVIESNDGVMAQCVVDV